MNDFDYVLRRDYVLNRFPGFGTKTCPFKNYPRRVAVSGGEGLTDAEIWSCRWLKLQLVATIDYPERTAANHLRHPMFVGLSENFSVLRTPVEPRPIRDGRAPTVRGFCEFDGGLQVREPSEGKIGRAVLTVALVAATAMLVLVLISFVGLVMQRNFQGAPIHRQAFHTAPQPPEHARP
jgi:hypothetical protein